MRTGLHSSLFCFVLASLSVVHAINFDVRVRTSLQPNALRARDNSNIIPVSNTRNAEYIANITLGGRQIPVLLDTGRCVRVRSQPLVGPVLTHYSSDLWVTGDVPRTKDLGKSVSVNYAVGTAAGTSPL